MIAGHDDDPSGIPGDAQKGRNLAKPLRRPGQVHLVRASQLCINGIVHHPDHDLLGICNGFLNPAGQFRAGDQVGLVEQARRTAGARRCDQPVMSGKASPFLCLVALGQPPGEEADTRHCGHTGQHRDRGWRGGTTTW